MTTMRAKVSVGSVHTLNPEYETVTFFGVAKNGAYPEDGSDEDNTYAKFSPSATFTLSIANPALIGKFNPGDKFYVDFSPVPEGK